MTNKEAALIILQVIEDYNHKPLPESYLHAEIWNEKQVEALARAAIILIQTTEKGDMNEQISDKG